VNLLDVNIWIASSIPGHAFHQIVVKWFRDQEQRQSIWFCRTTQQSYLRLLTNNSVMQPYGLPALSNHDAWDAYSRHLKDDRVGFCGEPPTLEDVWKSLTSQKSVSTKIWMDAYLAAFAIAGRYKLITTDKGFLHYSGLNVQLLTK
jgi:toxin-antitoxin system PIN domain toxin